MAMAQRISSQVLSLRKRERIRVRQPLQRILIPVLDDQTAQRVLAMEALIRSEVNVKEIVLIRDGEDSDISIVKKVKPDFKALGPRFGKRMKAVAAAILSMNSETIAVLERDGKVEVNPADGEGVALVDLGDVEIATEDIPGWLVSNSGGVTVALDITLSDSLLAEGLARELVNRVQNERKDAGFEVTARIQLTVDASAEVQQKLQLNLNYIAQETLADEVIWSQFSNTQDVELSEGHSVAIAVKKLN